MTKKVSVPSMTEMLQTHMVKELLADYPRELVVDCFRKVTAASRKQQLESGDKAKTLDCLLSEAKKMIAKAYQPTLKKVVNATGTILHTNLGRSKLPSDLKEQLLNVAFHFTNVEYDLETGQRGSRYEHLEKLLITLTGAEAALVVNNNAAAVLLSLSALASGKEVIVSRGELVEIGGSFRIPEIMKLSGCDLKEVGTTNKTYASDYERAIDEEQTGLLMKVHRSNFTISGFTESISLKELKTVADAAELPLIYDMGSGTLIELDKYGLRKEETVSGALRDGADIVTFSGDKLLGGPQAGIIVGKKEFIDQMKQHQLTRALRIDKLTIAMLEGTLRQYLDEEKAIQTIPALHMLTVSESVLKEKAETLFNSLSHLNEADITLTRGKSQVGGGSMPEQELSTWIVSVKPKKISVTEFAFRLRQGESPVIGRIHSDRYLLDVRTIEKEEIELISEKVTEILAF
ncbi:L-seryl-tRNA(Sec) selenium transferase [Vagococcus elongatus]|uniref:L-seryl-tRNA(Sec) selenium transferase n=1 Tax=Vagococcus elongatus TaxID=180344 RepID=A0A430AQF9_9ENTE|nr:L-seryl-tRNA(Sec) selenium transferase [Vagococcus elongatus]RSU10137.1 L-seryl-tRNA(Sec) selenium transferase [Vagococcus elongatus]